MTFPAAHRSNRSSSTTISTLRSPAVSACPLALLACNRGERSKKPQAEMAQAPAGRGESSWLSGGGFQFQEEDEADAFTERRPEARIINNTAVIRSSCFKAVRGLGYLALLWSTVVLLGGFVTGLTDTDFWFVTVSSFMQAAGLVFITPPVLSLRSSCSVIKMLVRTDFHPWPCDEFFWLIIALT